MWCANSPRLPLLKDSITLKWNWIAIFRPKNYDRQHLSPSRSNDYFVSPWNIIFLYTINESLSFGKIQFIDALIKADVVVVGVLSAVGWLWELAISCTKWYKDDGTINRLKIQIHIVEGVYLLKNGNRCTALNQEYWYTNSKCQQLSRVLYNQHTPHSMRCTFVKFNE